MPNDELSVSDVDWATPNWLTRWLLLRVAFPVPVTEGR